MGEEKRGASARAMVEIELMRYCESGHGNVRDGRRSRQFKPLRGSEQTLQTPQTRDAVLERLHIRSPRIPAAGGAIGA